MLNPIPAIDIIEGNCVRLSKGDYATKKVYDADPVALAKRFESYGFTHLHVVDLDGAKSAHVVNLPVLRAITAATNLQVDFGGGIKSDADLEAVFDAGAQAVTVGSIAVKNPELMQRWIERWGAERIILGADAKDGFISINGWKEDSQVALFDFLSDYRAKGIRRVLCTDISRDGMLSGPSIALYRQIMAQWPTCGLVASGGVSGLEDLKELDRAGIPAAVFGKAIYEGRLDPEEVAQIFLKK